MIIRRQRKRKQATGRFTGNPNKIKSLALIAIGVLFLQGALSFPLPELAHAQTTLPPEAHCSNGIDDNGDGLVDCEDSTCRTGSACPNIIVIMTDNMGWGDLCKQNPDSPACTKSWSCKGYEYCTSNADCVNDPSKNLPKLDCNDGTCYNSPVEVCKTSADCIYNFSTLKGCQPPVTIDTNTNTPSLDKLADDGVRLSNFYSPVPVCAPSRASFLTGRHPARSRMSDFPNTVNDSMSMQNSEVTLAEALSEIGYDTALIGKWQLGYREETLPWAQGFNYSYMIPTGAGYGAYGYCLVQNTGQNQSMDTAEWVFLKTHQEYSCPTCSTGPNQIHGQFCKDNTPVIDFWNVLRPDPQTPTRMRSLTEILTDQAVMYVKNKKTNYKGEEVNTTETIRDSNKPFFMFLALTAPHHPMDIHLPEPLATTVRSDSCPYTKYNTIDSDSTITTTEAYAQKALTDHGFKCTDGKECTAKCQIREAYPEVIREIDTRVQEVLNALKDPNGDTKEDDTIANNTIVIFTSDNGPYLGKYLDIEDIWDSTAGMRGAMRFNTEGGTRVPFIAKWPNGGWGPSEESTKLAELVDLYPTLYRAATNYDAQVVSIDQGTATKIQKNTSSSDFINDTNGNPVKFDGVDISCVLDDDCLTKQSYVNDIYFYNYQHAFLHDSSDPNIAEWQWGSFPTYAIRSNDLTINNVPLNEYKLYLDYDLSPKELYKEISTRNDPKLMENSEDLQSLEDPNLNEVVGILSGKATNYYQKALGLSLPGSTNFSLSHTGIPGYAYTLTINPKDPNIWLMMESYFADSSTGIPLPPDKQYHKTMVNGEQLSFLVDPNLETDINTTRPVSVTSSESYKYYLPSIKEKFSNGEFWENYITVKAKESVPMSVKLSVYDGAGGKVGTYIYNNTRDANEGPKPAGSSVSQMPKWIAGWNRDGEAMDFTDESFINNYPEIEGSVIVETNVPAIVSTNTIAAIGEEIKTAKTEGFNIYEAPKPRQKHSFPKNFDGPNKFTVYLLIQNIYNDERRVTITLTPKKKGDPGDGVSKTFNIPEYGTLRIRPCEVISIGLGSTPTGECNVDFDGSVEVSSDWRTDGDGLGLPIPALNRTEIYSGTSTKQFEAMTIYESPEKQYILSFPFLNDYTNYNGTLPNQTNQRANWITVMNPHGYPVCAVVSLYKVNNEMDPQTLSTNAIPAGIEIKPISINGKNTFRPCFSIPYNSGEISGANNYAFCQPGIKFEGSALVSLFEDLSPDPNNPCSAYDDRKPLPVLGQTNVIYAGNNSVYIDAYNIYEAAIPNSTLFFPKVYDNTTAGGHYVDNHLHIFNPDPERKNITYSLTDRNGTEVATKDETFGGFRNKKIRPKDLLTHKCSSSPDILWDYSHCIANCKVGGCQEITNDSYKLIKGGSIKVTATYNESGEPASITGIMRYEFHSTMISTTPIDAMTVYRSMGADTDECPLDPTLTSPVDYYYDGDGDGYGNMNWHLRTCENPPTGFVPNNTDCDDNNNSINPGYSNCPTPTGVGTASVSTCTTCHVDRAAKMSCRNKNWLQHLRKLWVDEATFTLAERTFLGAACRANSGGTTVITKDPSRKTGK